MYQSFPLQLVLFTFFYFVEILPYLKYVGCYLQEGKVHFVFHI